MMLGPTCRPETSYNPADRLFPIVRCMACYCEVAGANEDYRGTTAIAAWNRRPLLDELDASKARIAEGWQDIATAPKVDGGKCLLRVEHPNFAISHDPEWEAVVVAYWTDFNKGGWVWHGMLGTATHWLPHPEMPPHGDAK
jgi:hypothetical protein